MASQARARRLGNRIREELAELLRREVDDPRLTLVTVTGVDVDRELALAKVYVSAVDSRERMDEILKTLQGARGFLRSQLAARIPLRSFPQLRFCPDHSPDHGARIEEILQQLKQQERPNNGESSAERGIPGAGPVGDSG